MDETFIMQINIHRQHCHSFMFSRLLLQLIRAYQYLLRPWLGNQCRFTPRCSDYAMQAIALHGAWRGGWLAVWRLLRCQPLCNGGHDPVPGRCEHSAGECNEHNLL